MTLNIDSLSPELRKMIEAAIADQILSAKIADAMSDDRRGSTFAPKAKATVHAIPLTETEKGWNAQGYCACGCEGTSRNVQNGKSNWLPGHDAKNGRYSRR